MKGRYPPVTAAEKYATANRPLCPCGCGKPMTWNTDTQCVDGGQWRKPYHSSEKTRRRSAILIERTMRILDVVAEERGSRCCLCGTPYERGFHYHHRDPATKAFNPSSHGRSESSTRAELEKCDLLCPSCHGNIHHLAGTHCRYGRHLMTPENTYISPDGRRNCRECRRGAEYRRQVRRNPPST